jgi:outer membrane protein assembly factor BamB
MPHDEHLFTPDEVDEQIDWLERASRAQPPTPNTRVIQGLHRLYDNEQADAQSVDSVWQRLQERGAVPAAPPQRARRSGPLRLQWDSGPLPPTYYPAAPARLGLSTRLLTMVAAVLLVVVVSGLVAGLVLVHRGGPSGGRPLIDPRLHIYVGTQSDIQRLDASTGKRLWRHSTNGGANSTPAVAYGLVYIAPEGEALFALNANDGSVRWSFSRPVQAGQVALSAPVVVGNVLYIGDTQMDAVYALNAETGALLWQHPGPPETAQQYAAICDVSVVAQVVYSCEYSQSGGTWLIALNAETGALLWRTPALLPSFFDAPRVVDGAIYIPSWEWIDSFRYSSYLSAYNASNGQLLWRSSQFPAQIGSALAVADGAVYITTNQVIKTAANGTILQEEGDLFALNAGDGSTLWHYQTQMSLFISQQVVNAVLYAGAQPGIGSGRVMALDASDGSVRWQQQLHSRYIAAPMIALDGVLFVNEPDTFCALDATDGSQMWCTPLVSAIGAISIPFTVAP